MNDKEQMILNRLATLADGLTAEGQHNKAERVEAIMRDLKAILSTKAVA